MAGIIFVALDSLSHSFTHCMRDCFFPGVITLHKFAIRAKDNLTRRYYMVIIQARNGVNPFYLAHYMQLIIARFVHEIGPPVVHTFKKGEAVFWAQRRVHTHAYYVQCTMNRAWEICCTWTGFIFPTNQSHFAKKWNLTTDSQPLTTTSEGNHCKSRITPMKIALLDQKGVI